MARRPGTTRTNLAGRVGRWSARHRTIAIVGWLAFVVVVFLVGSTQERVEYKPADGSGETARAAQIYQQGDFPDEPSTEQVLVQTPSGTVTDPSVRAAVTDVVAAVEGTGQVANVLSVLDEEGAGLVSRDKRATLVTFDMTGEADTAADRVQPVLDAVRDVQAEHPGLRVEQFGWASADKALEETLGDDLKQAEILAVAVTGGILIGVFAAVIAALLPLILSLTAFVAALGLLTLTSPLVNVDENAQIVMLLVGVAVGVDYALFYIRREREERAKGRDARRALEIAAATSGRSVLISGITVLIAMAGLFFSGDQTNVAIGWGTMLVVAVAVLGSLTFLPATLAALGDRVEWLKIPVLHRFRTTDDSKVWTFVLNRVLRRPVTSAVLGTGAMVVLAVPAFALHTALPGVEDLPRSVPIMQTYDRIQAAFPGGQSPATVNVLAADVTTAPVQDALRELRTRALATDRMNEPIDVQVSPNERVAVVNVPLAGNGNDDASEAALAALRDAVIPATIGAVPGVQVAVDGQTAQSVDFTEQQIRNAPAVFGFVLGCAFLLLLLSFRSVVIAVTAIAFNLLSVGAAYGVLVAVFQWGWGEGLLGFTSTGAIASWLPIFLFVLLFGLSMDYHVFILSRIREAYDRGRSTTDAVRHGIASTAGVITSAAVIMVAVFAIFASLSQASLKQFGVGLAVAVLLDATLVRGVLLPAVMTLLGERNWYLPRWLRWLPELSHGEADDPDRTDGVDRSDGVDRAGEVGDADRAGDAGEAEPSRAAGVPVSTGGSGLSQRRTGGG
ncbi:MAG: MMPL family transporter [Angustibacter sp.]